MTAPTSATDRRAVSELHASLRAMSAAERRLAGHDRGPGELTYTQVQALAALSRAQEMTAGELARSAGLTPATVTGLLDQLESAGVVRRTRSTEDRRVCNVSMTDAGRELLESRSQAWRVYWARRLDPISDDDLQTATRVLDAVAALYDDAVDELGLDAERRKASRNAPNAHHARP
jgi:DNA-binding MarR family transcriptional regulator